MRIRSGAKILKPWLGIQVPATTTVQQLYIDFARGTLESSSHQIPDEYNSAKIWATMGKSENDKKISIDITVTIGEATAIIGYYLDFNVEKLDKPTPSSSKPTLEGPSAFGIMLKSAKNKSFLPD